MKYEFGGLIVIDIPDFADNEREPELPIQHTYRALGDVAVDANTFRQNVVDQFDQAYEAFETTIDMLNVARAASDKITDKLETPEPRVVLSELEPWLTDAKVNYAVADINANPGVDYQLIATPNVYTTPTEITDAIRELAQEVSPWPQVPSGVLDSYGPEEVSGTQPETGYYAKFKLVRDLPNEEMYGEGYAQRQMLSELRVKYPFLEATSPLEDLVFLNALRANGIQFGGRPNYHPILLRRNFMMRSNKFHSLPCTYVSTRGDLTLSPDSATTPRDGFISIG